MVEGFCLIQTIGAKMMARVIHIVGPRTGILGSEGNFSGIVN